ncbi:MAG: hypothetical protein J0I62_11070 [Microbacterium sp.]|nr:hypothetical protein [Microbacterium sp.]
MIAHGHSLLRIDVDSILPRRRRMRIVSARAILLLMGVGPGFAILPGEEVKWSGSPDPNVRFTRADTFFVPFSLVWTGFAVLWTLTAARSPAAPPLIWLIGVAFVAAGVYAVVGRFYVKAHVKRRTRYYLTNWRAIIVTDQREDALDVDRKAPPTTTPHRSHLDVAFGNRSGPLSRLPGYSMLRIYANTGMDFFARVGPGLPFAFYDVPDVEGLQAALHELRTERDQAGV